MYCITLNYGRSRINVKSHLVAGVKHTVTMCSNAISKPSEVLKLLHQGHSSNTRMKGMATSFMWQPKMDSDLEKKVKSCFRCQWNSQLFQFHVSLHTVLYLLKPIKIVQINTHMHTQYCCNTNNFLQFLLKNILMIVQYGLQAFVDSQLAM